MSIEVINAPASEQKSSFMNGTLSTLTHGMAVTIQIYPSVPADVTRLGRKAVTRYLCNMLTGLDAEVTIIIGKDDQS